MMIYHILNGDALAEKFPKDLEGKIIVIREAFMDGPVSEVFDEPYWDERKQFISEAFDVHPDAYRRSFANQLALMNGIVDGDEVYLWFEDDLFCQVNMWMAVNYILQHAKPVFYRIFPEADEVRWKGFGNDDEMSLKKLFVNKVRLKKPDVEWIQQLWTAYVSEDVDAMRKLGATKNNATRFLPVVIEAHIARLHPDVNEKQPEKLLREIMHEGKTQFEEIFAEFSKRAGEYGYGDSQIRKIVRL